MKLDGLDGVWKQREAGEIVILDNRDSFVFNLAHRLWECGGRDISVIRSDRIDCDVLESWRPRAIVLSPGPGRPEDAGCSIDVVRRFSGRVPILGVCLGHQAIARAFGAEVSVSGHPMHGKATVVEHDGNGLYEGLPERFLVGRYHSLHVESPGKELIATAWSDGFNMGIRHRDFPTFGVQFHPESVLTPCGPQLLQNFLRSAAAGQTPL